MFNNLTTRKEHDFCVVEELPSKLFWIFYNKLQLIAFIEQTISFTRNVCLHAISLIILVIFKSVFLFLDQVNCVIIIFECFVLKLNRKFGLNYFRGIRAIFEFFYASKINHFPCRLRLLFRYQYRFE